jgi:hypothetical protein
MKFLHRSVLAALLLLGVGPAAHAVEHQVFGQVLQVKAKDAADSLISDNALSGSPRPFVHVRVFDADTLEPLGEVDSDVDGRFSVTFDKPETYTPRITCRVLQMLQNPDTLAIEAQVLAPAREGINTFSGVPRYFLTFLKVVADDSLAYGDMSADAGLGGDPGVGLVFTRVGKTETQFIRQNTTPTGGLADFTSDPGRAAELGVPAFRDAPFGGQLFLYGEFGPCSAPPGRIDYYRVKIRRVDPAPGPWRFWSQPLHKTRTLVTTAPTLSIVHQIVPVGPFSGTLGGGAVDDLYWVNRNQVGGAVSTFYSFPDLRILWSTGGWPDGDGLYEIGLEYYVYDSGDVDHPVVHQLASPGCIHSPAAPVGQLYLRVNNQPVDLKLEGLFLKSAAGYLGRDPVTGAPIDVPSTAGALNFATTGLCEILELAGVYDVEARFRARHLGNYMGWYSLQATPNDGLPVQFAAAHYPDATEVPTFPAGAAPPLWSGAASGTIALRAHSQFVKCGYIFDLSGASRIQNGDQYLGGPREEKAWYIRP